MKWTKTQVARLVHMHSLGLTPAIIAKALNRSGVSITCKSSLIGLTYANAVERAVKPLKKILLHADGSRVAYTDSPHARPQPFKPPYVRANY